jgi:outer membrane protein assembly factor BamE
MSTLLTTYIKFRLFLRAVAARIAPAAGRPDRGRPGVRLRRVVAMLAMAVVLPGCGSITHFLPGFLTPYRPDIQQGNVITSEMVEQLRPGMTRDQVRFMLGTPLLADAFHKDRWDYLYYLNPRIGSTQRRNLVIYFADNRLDHFQSDPMPPESMADNLILGRKRKAALVPKSKEPAAEMKQADADQKEPAALPSEPATQQSQPATESNEPAAEPATSRSP